MRLAARTMVVVVATAMAAVSPLSGAEQGNEAQATALRASIDAAVTETLTRTGAPSASIAVVQDGRLIYAHAYGSARLDPPLAAAADMRYAVGSISKQFTSAAVLMLSEEGKLSLEDKVGRWLPDLTRANEVSLRELLSMTSGYQDYWPQDYVMPPMLQPTTAQAILNEWAKKPLDFDPGTKWQYSNTNYVAAGLIVEKAGGMPLADFLQRRVFAPLGMTSVANVDLGPLGERDPTRYLRYAIGPLRPAPKEGRGWLFAAGELAMTASDLARWDIATIDMAVLKPASYREMQREVLLKSGVGTRYGLGVSIDLAGGRRRIFHGGEVSGFTAANDIYPDDRAAIVVLVNLDATGASSAISGRIASLLFATTDRASEEALGQARRIFEGLQQGKIDRSAFTANANAYFSDEALTDFSSSLGPLGRPLSFVQQGQSFRGGMIFRSFLIRFTQRSLRLTTFAMPDGKLEQYQIAAVE